MISTIAGNGGTGAHSGDGGEATSAALYNPCGIALDSTGWCILLSLLQLVLSCTLHRFCGLHR